MPIWVRDSAALAELGERARHADWIALDTESNSAHVYRERVCLLQLLLPDACYLIDSLQLPSEPASLAPLAPALANPEQPLYLHGGEYDVICLRRDYDLRLRGIVDSQQASSLLGWQRTGYGAVVEAICQVTLPKGHSQYNWGKRPIDEEALDYAIQDVQYLPTVCQHLQQQITDADLAEEFAIACAAVEEAEARCTTFDPAGIWRLKGVWRLPPRCRPVLVGLYTWRDQQAKRLDQPPGRIINNELLLALAKQAPRNFGQLKRLRLKGWFLRELGNELIEVVKQADQEPPAVPEPPRQREVDEAEEVRSKRLKDWRLQESKRRQTPLQVVLPARALEYLKRYGASDLSAVPQLGAKRSARYGETLRKLCRQ